MSKRRPVETRLHSMCPVPPGNRNRTVAMSSVVFGTRRPRSPSAPSRKAAVRERGRAVRDHRLEGAEHLLDLEAGDEEEVAEAVRADVADHARPGARGVVAPAVRQLRVGHEVAVEVEPGVAEPADLALGHGPAREPVDRVLDVVEADEGRHALAAGGLAHPEGELGRVGERLLAVDVLARLDRPPWRPRSARRWACRRRRCRSRDRPRPRASPAPRGRSRTRPRPAPRGRGSRRRRRPAPARPAPGRRPAGRPGRPPSAPCPSSRPRRGRSAAPS